MVATIQLTFPGMASIFYGDEVGLTGQDDPDDRRPYPWGAEDPEVLASYQSLALLREHSVALREGDLTFLGADDAAGTLAYLRRAPTPRRPWWPSTWASRTDRWSSTSPAELPDGHAADLAAR